MVDAAFLSTTFQSSKLLCTNLHALVSADPPYWYLLIWAAYSANVHGAYFAGLADDTNVGIAAAMRSTGGDTKYGIEYRGFVVEILASDSERGGKVTR